MPFAIIDSGKLYFRLEGSSTKPLIVLVHSLGCDHGMWDLQVPTLLQHFQVLRIDLRGHGASDVTPGEYSMEMLASDVLKVIDSTKRDRFAYCGLSLGGMIGQRLASTVGSRMQGLVLANTSPKMPDPALFAARSKIVLEQGMAAVEESVMARFFMSETLGSSNPGVESIRMVLTATNPVGYAGCCAAIRDMDQRWLLARLKLPVLVIAGDQDVSTPWVGHGDLLASLIPGAKSVLLHAAHLSNVEQPEAFTSALLSLLTTQ